MKTEDELDRAIELLGGALELAKRSPFTTDENRGYFVWAGNLIHRRLEEIIQQRDVMRTIVEKERSTSET